MAGCDPLPPAAGVVLDIFEHGESDLIAVIFTRERGRLAAIAKGAKKSRRRFVNKLEPFTSLELLLSPSRRSTLFRLDEAEIISSRPGLRFDHRRYAAASLVCELVIHWTRETDPAPELFHLLEWSLDQMEKGDLSWVLPVFLVRLIDLTGHRPLLDACAVCGAASSGPMRMSHAHHGVVCRRCDPQGSGGTVLNAGEIRTMRELADAPPERTGRIRIGAKSRRTITETMIRYSTWLLQREPASWKAAADIFPA